jgi:hypothetical protein
MRYLIGLVLVVGGIVMVVMGVKESDSFASDVSRFFSGNPTDRSVWLTLGGIGAIVVGLGAAVVPLGSRRSS